MKTTLKRSFALILSVLLLALSLAACGRTEADPAPASTEPVAAESAPETSGSPAEASSEVAENAAESTPESYTVAIRDIRKHGNVILDTDFDAMNAHGMEIGDIITATVGEKSYDIPIGTAHADVDSGSMLCRFDTEDNEVSLAINMGSFASEAGIGEKVSIEEEPGYRWDIAIGEVTLSLKEKQGYRAEYDARNLTRTNERADYPALTDEEFSNFRAVAAAGIREDWLYRSSTPIEPALGRNEYAMAAMEKAGIRAVINLDDSVDEMKSYPAYPGSWYSRCAVVNPEMTYDFGTGEFAGKVKQSVLFLLENDGPFLIHCKEGKDRTGILCAILECFAGASAEEVTGDYMLTYANFYGILPGDGAYDVILSNNLVKTLCGLYGIDSLNGTDLQKEAADYLLSTGLDETQLHQLAAKLGA
ncbi:MAG: tyrosine-protein phosphatase [Eubacteriales bacterium]|nr:tyrosine-protein phosphatase [Eubacteriales bacterium]